MALRIGINGFGRIGRLVLRALSESNKQDITVVAVNDLMPVADQAHLFQYDSIHGTFREKITLTHQTMDIGMGPITLLQEKDPQNLPWKDLDVHMVFECSGHMTSREKSAIHLNQGAKAVLISAPGDQADLTVVYGVNDHLLNGSHKVVSNGSCTTNCLAPVAQVLHQTVGIEKGFMTTIHAYTGDQRLVDGGHSDLRRGRAAALSMIPTSTGAAKALGLVLPELSGKLDGTAIRVPTPNVSLIDFTFTSSKKTSVQEINQSLYDAHLEGSLKSVLGYVDGPFVSCDFNHSPLSSIFDSTQTHVIDGHLCRVLSWYDNEWGFAHRMMDTARVMARFL